MSKDYYPYMQKTRDFEGFTNSVYPGAVQGEPTIGYGFNLNSPMFQGMSPDYVVAHAEELFDKAYKSARFDAANFIGYEKFTKLSPERQAVLTDMAYNLGPTRLAKFEKLKAALDKEDYNTSVNEMVNSKWYSQVGNRSKTLVKVMKENKW